MKIDTKRNVATFTILPTVLVSFINITTTPNTAINPLTNIIFFSHLQCPTPISSSYNQSHFWIGDS